MGLGFKDLPSTFATRKVLAALCLQAGCDIHLKHLFSSKVFYYDLVCLLILMLVHLTRLASVTKCSMRRLRVR